MKGEELGLVHFWQAGDAVTHGVAYLLLAMSIASWYLILSKSWSAWRRRRGVRAGLQRFWAASSIDEAMQSLHKADGEALLVPLATRAIAAASSAPQPTLAGSIDREKAISRAMRAEITQASARLENGLSLLASVGSTAPFVGLFGTVWGIYHALLAIASSGQVQIDRVAGPVGEALVMTGAGLAVAIPAVLGYNAFVRLNRVAMADLDSFAHDLLALLLEREPARR
jgi:biopolymer transport protein ExbB